VILFKLMDLALIVHHPSLENDRQTLIRSQQGRLELAAS
jgi:hypothetical protein